eukprot:g16059.t1
MFVADTAAPPQATGTPFLFLLFSGLGRREGEGLPLPAALTSVTVEAPHDQRPRPLRPLGTVEQHQLLHQ